MRRTERVARSPHLCSESRLQAVFLPPTPPRERGTSNGLRPTSAGGGEGRCAPGGFGLPSPRTQPFQGWGVWRAWIPGVAPRGSGQPRAAGRNRVAVGGPAIVVGGKTMSLLAQWPLPTCGPCHTRSPGSLDSYAPSPYPHFMGRGGSKVHLFPRPACGVSRPQAEIPAGSKGWGEGKWSCQS